MADKHRRRLVKSDEESEGSFTESDVDADDTTDAANSPKETPEKNNRRKALDGSEYESAEEEGDDKSLTKTDLESKSKEQELDSPSELVDEEGGIEEIADAEDVDGDFLSEDPQEDDTSDNADYVEEERQQGDGEECSPSNNVVEKELDFDEDRRNPQYIPKKGIFYEHDDRNNEDVKEKEDPSREKKKKLWLDEGKWGHDRFREEEQFPKSRGELIEVYGYDIRCEDGPPRARRRRRYGRGPTKYERNWEDVNAYGRERFKATIRGFFRGRRAQGRFRGSMRFRGRGRRQYFSQSSEKNDKSQESSEKTISSTSSSGKDNAPQLPISDKTEFPSLPSKDKEATIENSPEKEQSPNNIIHPVENIEKKTLRTLTFENSNLNNSKPIIKYEVPPRRGKAMNFIGNNYYRTNTRRPVQRTSRGSSRGDYSRRGRGARRHISPRFMEYKTNTLQTAMENLTIEENHVSEDINSEMVQEEDVTAASHGNDSSNIVLKGGGDSSGRPKRYSSLRQRNLPEANTYRTSQPSVVPPRATFYESGFQANLYGTSETGVPVASTQSQTVTSPPIMNPSAYQTFAPSPYPDNYGLRMPVANPPRLFPQVTVPAGQPLLAPPPCIAAPSPNIMNFAPPAPPPPTSYTQFAYQQYATPPPAPPAQPSEMFAPGITYYYPQSQPPPSRPTVQKRPKAAIPILPPPDNDAKRNLSETSPQIEKCDNENYVCTLNSTTPNSAELADLRSEPSSSLQIQQPSVGVES